MTNISHVHRISTDLIPPWHIQYEVDMNIMKLFIIYPNFIHLQLMFEYLPMHIISQLNRLWIFIFILKLSQLKELGSTVIVTE
jgi:hypothetical protein